jgi:hypothetical protein
MKAQHCRTRRLANSLRALNCASRRFSAATGGILRSLARKVDPGGLSSSSSHSASVSGR